MVPGCLRFGIRLWRAIAQAHQPVAAVPQVVAGFFDRALGNGGQLGIGRLPQRLPSQHHQGAIEEIAHDGDGVVTLAAFIDAVWHAVRQFQKGEIAEIGGVAEVGEGVLRGPVCFKSCNVLVEHPCLTNQIHTDVGHCNVFFQHRAMAAPLCIALAQHEGVVGQMQQVLKVRDRKVRGGSYRARPSRCVTGHVSHQSRHHMCPTSSGI